MSADDLSTTQDQPIDSAFPFASYRPYQREILAEAAETLFGADAEYDNLVIYAPTGIGKSPINVALANLAEDAFYTTPQKKLRHQLETDDVLREHYQVLRAREDYDCEYASHPGWPVSCAACPIYHDDERACRNYTPGCGYWERKELAMESPVATLTFSYLVADGYLDTEVETNNGPRQVSFDDRELLIVDECHQLENQVASLFAGFAVAPSSSEEFNDVYGELAERIPGTTDRVTDAVAAEIRQLGQRAAVAVEDFGEQLAHLEEITRDSTTSRERERLSRLVSRCDRIGRQCEWCLSELAEGRTWTVDVDTQSGRVQFSPVLVDCFLETFLWNRAEKRVLSTATMPFADNPTQWFRNIGLDPEGTKVIERPMPFPPENRLVNLARSIGRMSRGRDEEYWPTIVDTIEHLANRHAGEKGLIHTASYARAEQLHEDLPGGLSILHEQDGGLHDDAWYINQWQNGDADVLLSPALTDGVDLPGETCRWQTLLKVPYPNPTDARVDARLEELDGDQWYYETTAQSVIQAVGRGVRHVEDYCTFYVLDESYLDVRRRVAFPEWFLDAEARIDVPSKPQRSLLD
jgi:Rad3-related DNA helicase